MNDPLSIVNDALLALSESEAQLEASLEGLNPVTQRSQRALLVSELSSLRPEVRALQRQQQRICAGEAVLEPDAEALAQLAEAVTSLRAVAGKGAKVEALTGAIGAALGAAKMVMASA